MKDVVADEERWLEREDAIGEELVEAGVSPTVDDELGDGVEVGARIDVVRDARRDDGEDARGTHRALVAPGEEPVFSAENETSELAFASVVGRLDVAVVKEENEAMPLTMEVAEGAAERSLRRNDAALVVEPRAEIVDDGRGVALSASATLISGVARERRSALDGEEARDDVEPFARDDVTGASGVDETSAAMTPATRPRAASALEERHDAGAVALHGAREVRAEEAFDAVGVADF